MLCFEVRVSRNAARRRKPGVAILDAWLRRRVDGEPGNSDQETRERGKLVRGEAAGGAGR